MGYTHGCYIESPTRICTKCNKELLNTPEYFCYAKKSTGQLSAVCKECKKIIEKEKREAMIEKNKNLSLFYDGTKKCKKCERDLPNNKLYFPVDLSTKAGLRNVCRECIGREFLPFDYKVNEKWSDEEDRCLIENYQHYTGEELKEKFFPNRTIRAIESRANTLNISYKSEETYLRSLKIRGKKCSKATKGKPISEERKIACRENLKKYYETHDYYWLGKKWSDERRKNRSEYLLSIGKWSGEDNPRCKNPLIGESNPNWNGGLSNIISRFRAEDKEWFLDSIQYCNEKCVICGLRFDNVHHTTAFKDIVDEVFDNSNIERKNIIGDYSEYEYRSLVQNVKEIHNKYGFGACLNEKIHILFHNIYGYKDFTPHDFLDFVNRIEDGEFDDWFKENNLEIKINYDYIKYLKSILLKLPEYA